MMRAETSPGAGTLQTLPGRGVLLCAYGIPARSENSRSLYSSCVRAFTRARALCEVKRNLYGSVMVLFCIALEACFEGQVFEPAPGRSCTRTSYGLYDFIDLYYYFR